jgi:endonuclease YncB( thermonuclease family)
VVANIAKPIGRDGALKNTLIGILLLLIPSFSFAKEGPVKHESQVPIEKPLVCTEKHSFRCFKYHPPNDPENSFQELSLERVIDGGMIVANGKAIRLWGIIPQEKGDPLYETATFLLEVITKHGKLTCQQLGIDIYRIAVMRCFIDNTDVGSMMVRMGMAQDYSVYSTGYYAYEEDRARREGRGIWKEKREEK